MPIMGEMNTENILSFQAIPLFPRAIYSLNVKKVLVFLFCFFKGVGTVDEKWILYNNVECKISYDKQKELSLTVPKTGLHPMRLILCI